VQSGYKVTDIQHHSGIRFGVYRHYKGKYYFVYEVARHSETLEELVVYRCLYGKRDLWVRPLAMFSGSVQLNGVERPRFEWVAESEEELEDA
jgi:hypothetical protein